MNRHEAIEQRVVQFSDPVAKLRYLRRVQGLSISPQPAMPAWPWLPLVRMSLVISILLIIPSPTSSDFALLRQEGDLSKGPTLARTAAPDVWPVEQRDGADFYSNGLRIENTHAVDGPKRPYPVYDRLTLRLLEWRTEPVGIVYHTTESHIAPFDEEHSGRLRRVGSWMLDHVKKNGAYHFVIDRFGRVHRVVREGSSASHAGYSVWADESKLFVNLNPSFLGVALESSSETASSALTPAQVHSARVLTEMLRSRFRIPAGNCATHAQVSVVPGIIAMGNHVDWAAGFPFEQIGLPDNYGVPLPAVSIFGFRASEGYLKLSSPSLWKAVALAESQLRREAASQKRTLSGHRDALIKRYRQILKTVEGIAEVMEKTT